MISPSMSAHAVEMQLRATAAGRLRRCAIALALAAGLVAAACPAFAAPWSFGVLSDTQWTHPKADAMNPNTIPVSVVKQVDAQFISKGVALVVAVGDTVEEPGKNNVNFDARALYAQDLYNAGIGFYPLRGNHDAQGASTGVEFGRAFPQIIPGPGAGVNNNTPAAITTNILDPPQAATVNPPAARSGSTFVVGKNFPLPQRTLRIVPIPTRSSTTTPRSFCWINSAGTARAPRGRLPSSSLGSPA